MTVYINVGAAMYLKDSYEENKMQQKEFVETLYSDIKKLTIRNLLDADSVGALAELFTELANRLKEEESAK